MRAMIKRNKASNNATYYVVVGVIDENGEYNESHIEDVSLHDLPKNVAKVLRKGNDVSYHIIPKSEILIFFKSRNTMDQYLTEMQLDPECFEGLLTAFSKYDNPPLWGFYQLGDVNRYGCSIPKHKE